MKKLVLSSILFFLISYTVQGQVLISLLLGDKLNSDKIEFGLIGGLSASSLSDLEDRERLNAANLGMYFDIRMKGRWSFAPCYYAISKMGAKNLSPYPTGDPDLDLILQEADVSRELKYLQFPLLFRYRFTGKFYLQAGPQIGLLTKANDYFSIDPASNYSGEVSHNIRSDYRFLDAGLTAGLGYAFKEKKGMHLGLNYYQGLTDISKSSDTNEKVSSFYLYMTVPIGVQKKSKSDI